MRMLTLRRCCLPGGVDRSEGVRNTTVSFIEIEMARGDRGKGDLLIMIEGIALVRRGEI